MSDKLKVTFTSIEVRNNGEWTGKGELFWDLKVDGESVDSRPKSSPLKVADGESITLGNSRALAKESGQTLVIEGSVSEKDSLDKDDFAPVHDSYTHQMNWGMGTHRKTLRDNRLDAVLTYKIERQ